MTFVSVVGVEEEEDCKAASNEKWEIGKWEWENLCTRNMNSGMRKKLIH